MTGMFIWLVYCGGMTARPDLKIGFMNRATWPIMLGKWLYTFLISRGFSE